MEKIYDDFKTYEGYENKFIIENYIRHKTIDTVLKAFDDVNILMDYMDENNLWESEYDQFFEIDENGRAFYPTL